ncbi:DUF3137 domain-containing protein [Candidatus Saccharibacteria bacterium]|nr:DUF3137 domain-containing protein [Candidatus Saccharibacteria bacterium]
MDDNIDYKEFEAAKAAFFKKQKRTIYVCLFIMLFVLIPFLVVFAFVGSLFLLLGPIVLAFFLLLFALSVGSVFSSYSQIGLMLFAKQYYQYKAAYKKYFVRRNMKNFFTNVSYSHNMGLPSLLIRDTGMINMGNRYYSNDFTQGKYKDVDFVQADVTIQKVRSDSEGKEYSTTIFKGRWMIFDFPKKFNFRLKVVSRKFGYASIDPGKNPKTKHKMKKVETESITFNKEFSVYADDEFEAFYLLDPSFIDNVEKLVQGKKHKIILCFVDNHLHIGVYDNQDFFEPPLREKDFISEKDEDKKILSQIATITNFVDFLKLDHKIFK